MIYCFRNSLLFCQTEYIKDGRAWQKPMCTCCISFLYCSNVSSIPTAFNSAIVYFVIHLLTVSLWTILLDWVVLLKELNIQENFSTENVCTLIQVNKHYWMPNMSRYLCSTAGEMQRACSLPSSSHPKCLWKGNSMKNIP